MIILKYLLLQIIGKEELKLLIVLKICHRWNNGFAAFFAINKEFRKPAEAPELFMVP